MARLRLLLGYIVMLGAFCLGHRHLQWWALVFVIFGSAIRIWSACTLIKTTELSTDGPYALSRNPLYLGTFVAGIGLTLFVNSWPLLVFFLITFTLAYRAQILWEEKLLYREHGQPFRQYCTEVGRFFPKKWNPQALHGSFSLKRLKENRELAYQLLWVVIVIGLVAKGYLADNGIHFSLP